MFLERPHLTRALLVLTSIAAAVLLVETAGRAVILLRTMLRSSAVERPLAYEHAEYYSPQFLDEQSRVGLVRAASGRYLLNGDLTGQYINIVNGLRRTTNRPSSWTRRLLVFGGSTIFSGEVPDQHTIPSYLQRTINDRCETRIAVFNYGVSSMTVGQNLAHLMDAGVQASDLVILYGGVNDVYYTVYGDDPPLKEIDSTRRFQRLVNRIINASVIGGAAATLHGRNLVPQADQSVSGGRLERVEVEYRQRLLDMNRFVTAHGGAFVHFLQPQLFATPPATRYRRDMVSEDDALRAAFHLGYPRLRQAMRQAGQAGVESFDLSRLLATERVPREVFLDFAHVNAIANEIVAGAIFSRIAHRIGDCDD